MGDNIEVAFQSSLGTFDEVTGLTVTSVQSAGTSLRIAADGTIEEEEPPGSVPTLDDAPVFYSALYTQYGGAGTPITGTFSLSTTPPAGSPVPEPASIALLGAALAGLGAARRRFRKH